VKDVEADIARHLAEAMEVVSARQVQVIQNRIPAFGKKKKE
jgi:hypothetical protein